MAKNTGCTEADAKKVVRKGTAVPGTSAHETGNAVDIWVGIDISLAEGKKLNDKKSRTYKRNGPFYEWCKQAAPGAGFHPYAPEPWHWERWS